MPRSHAAKYADNEAPTYELRQIPPYDRRFELVTIAFKEALRGHWDGIPVEVAATVVNFADAVLAEMGKDAPDAKEIEERARKLAGDVLTSIRAELKT